MLTRIKIIIASLILSVFILNNIGCAAAWFLAGAGTAATVIVASDEIDKDEAKKK